MCFILVRWPQPQKYLKHPLRLHFAGIKVDTIFCPTFHDMTMNSLRGTFVVTSLVLQLHDDMHVATWWSPEATQWRNRCMILAVTLIQQLKPDSGLRCRRGVVSSDIDSDLMKMGKHTHTQRVCVGCRERTRDGKENFTTAALHRTGTKKERSVLNDKGSHKGTQ